MKPDADTRKRAWLRYAGAGVQLVVTVLGMTWLGYYLDNRFALATPWWTLAFALAGCMLGLYFMIKSFLK